ncbi:MAG: protein-L-isoaspartate(D-aspartate) O-methyltransferase [Desulfomonilaceae bacterium]|nr:protein-L-isoaspartate(D-aspartate) O-methyltransferase [Desulfomonilaceae bacterium]
MWYNPSDPEDLKKLNRRDAGATEEVGMMLEPLGVGYGRRTGILAVVFSRTRRPCWVSNMARKTVLIVLCVFVLYSAAMIPSAAADVGTGPDAFSERTEERKEMVRSQFRGIGRTTITDKAVLDSMLRVPRHSFVPAKYRAFAYRDSPMPIGYGQTISQPYIVALMTQALELKPGMKVLEIGTGSGYQAAVLAEITDRVYTIEIIKGLYVSASERLSHLGYSSVHTKLGDGYHGWKEHAPFDRIIVTAAALHVPPPLFEQLKPGGKMVIPVGGQFETQRLLLVKRDDEGRRTSETLTLVRFVPLLRDAPGD